MVAFRRALQAAVIDVTKSPFGMLLWRLLSHRRPTFDTSIPQMWAVLARDAEVPSGELAAVIRDGVVPGSDLVRKLAPALGIRTADLFVIAGLPVPGDLASAWPTSPWDVGAILHHAVRMNADQRRHLQGLVRSLPTPPHTTSVPSYDDFPDTPGALLLRLLRNRNIRSRTARILNAVGAGPYVSEAPVLGLGRGTVVITPQYVTAFAHLLGYPPGDLVALTGVGPVIEDARVHPASTEIAALAWQARRLDNEQLSTVLAAAQSIRQT